MNEEELRQSQERIEANATAEREYQEKVLTFRASICPLQQSLTTCYREHCAWWDLYACAILTISKALECIPGANDLAESVALATPAE